MLSKEMIRNVEELEKQIDLEIKIAFNILEGKSMYLSESQIGRMSQSEMREYEKNVQEHLARKKLEVFGSTGYLLDDIEPEEWLVKFAGTFARELRVGDHIVISNERMNVEKNLGNGYFKVERGIMGTKANKISALTRVEKIGSPIV